MKKLIITVLALMMAGCVTEEIKEPEAKKDLDVKRMDVTAMSYPKVEIMVAYTDAPPYQKGDYYVWTVEAVAVAALDAINTAGWFPITGVNAKTKQPSPDKAKTTKWASEVQATADGKFVFPRIPNTIMDAAQVPEEERKGWWDAFQPDVEQYDPNWFPPDEE